MLKKIKWFLLTPVIALASATAVSITSCDSPNWVDPIEMVDISSFMPEFDPLEHIDYGITPDEATQKYIEWTTQNPDYFIQDMLYGVSERYNVWSEQIYGPGTIAISGCKCGFSKPTFGKTTVWVRGFGDVPFDTISFRKKMDIEYVWDKLMFSKVTQHITMDIEYKNIIFGVIPPHKLNETLEADHINWSVGFINEVLEEEAFWSHMYNTHPWSISFGCANQITETIFDSETHQIVTELHNTHYYSGALDSYTKLFDYYDLERSIGAGGTETTPFDRLSREIIVSILNLKNKSYWLNRQANKPDFCINNHVRSTISSGTDLKLTGFKLIRPKNLVGWNVSLNKIYLQEGFSAIENTTDPSPRILSVSSGTEFEPISQEPDEEIYLLGAKLDSPFQESPVDVWHSFNLEKPTIKVGIDYTMTKGSETLTGTLSIDVNLHYNTIDIKQMPQ